MQHSYRFNIFFKLSMCRNQNNFFAEERATSIFAFFVVRGVMPAGGFLFLDWNNYIVIDYIVWDSEYYRAIWRFFWCFLPGLESTNFLSSLFLLLERHRWYLQPKDLYARRRNFLDFCELLSTCLCALCALLIVPVPRHRERGRNRVLQISEKLNLISYYEGIYK